MNHSWMSTGKFPTLIKHLPNGRVIWTEGYEDACRKAGCPVLRRSTPSRHGVTYSADRGRHWGPVGGPRPPCEGRP